MKKTLTKKVEQIDAAKKVNPLDLSPDQDLSIGLMNLICIEDKLATMSDADAFLGAVRDMREKYLVRFVPAGGDNARAAWYLLNHAMQNIDAGNHAMDADNAKQAYAHYDMAYELYAVFWGAIMGLTNVADAAPDIWRMVQDKKIKFAVDSRLENVIK